MTWLKPYLPKSPEDGKSSGLQSEKVLDDDSAQYCQPRINFKAEYVVSLNVSFRLARDRQNMPCRVRLG